MQSLLIPSLAPHPTPPPPSPVSQGSLIMGCIPWPAVTCGEEHPTPWPTMAPWGPRRLLKSCPVSMPARPATLPPPSSTTCTARTLLRAQVCISMSLLLPHMHVDPQAERDRRTDKEAVKHDTVNQYGEYDRMLCMLPLENCSFDLYCFVITTCFYRFDVWNLVTVIHVSFLSRGCDDYHLKKCYSLQKKVSCGFCVTACVKMCGKDLPVQAFNVSTFGGYCRNQVVFELGSLLLQFPDNTVYQMGIRITVILFLQFF